MSPVYESDPAAAPDSEYVPGTLGHLVVGNRGRLLDQRRTPVRIVAVCPGRGEFELEIEAFEDAGAHWRLALGDGKGLQFGRDAARANPAVLTTMEQAVVKFDRVLRIEADPRAREETLRRIADVAATARAWVSARAEPGRVDVDGCVARRQGDPRLFALLQEFLAERDVVDLDRTFAGAFVTNPASGELVKGHAIVLAELGLCPYHGKIVRDPALFDGAGSKDRRAQHLIARLGFSAGLWAFLGRETATLYRGAAVEGPLEQRPPASFVSATFSAEVAQDHFAGDAKTQAAALWRQAVPRSRLLMTFLETPELNERFKEAEGILVADPANVAF